MNDDSPGKETGAVNEKGRTGLEQGLSEPTDQAPAPSHLRAAMPAILPLAFVLLKEVITSIVDLMTHGDGLTMFVIVKDFSWSPMAFHLWAMLTLKDGRSLAGGGLVTRKSGFMGFRQEYETHILLLSIVVNVCAYACAVGWEKLGKSNDAGLLGMVAGLLIVAQFTLIAVLLLPNRRLATN